MDARQTRRGRHLALRAIAILIHQEVDGLRHDLSVQLHEEEEEEEEPEQQQQQHQQQWSDHDASDNNGNNVIYRGSNSESYRNWVEAHDAHPRCLRC
ncbi:hypothetical protein GPALN_009749 [Globodera pallida]|nr:hypothetical protein GPALN_009749 [Globodera pallida]